ncbi:MAG: hypothetical protein EHM15_05605, partial [Desulfobacteraceae bacterium]
MAFSAGSVNAARGRFEVNSDFAVDQGVEFCDKLRLQVLLNFGFKDMTMPVEPIRRHLLKKIAAACRSAYDHTPEGLQIDFPPDLSLGHF